MLENIEAELSFADTRANGEVAPIPVVREAAMEPRGSTHAGRRMVVWVNPKADIW